MVLYIIHLFIYIEYGGSKEFPVTLFQLPKLGSDEMELEKGSRHKLMIENALKIAVESLIFSEKFSEILTGCPIEVTKVGSIRLMIVRYQSVNKLLGIIRNWNHDLNFTYSSFYIIYIWQNMLSGIFP